MTRRGVNDGDGIVALLKETVDGLGQLVADHVNLARIELQTDARIYGRGLAVVVVASSLLMLGYAFAWTAAALALAPLLGAPLSFAGVAALHLMIGGAGVASAARKMRRTGILRDSGTEAVRSVRTLMKPLAPERLDGQPLDGRRPDGHRLDGGGTRDD